MISHAFNSASTCLHTATSSKPLRAFPKLDKPSSAPETGSSPTGVAKKQDPKLSTSNPGKGLQNSSVSKKADKITSHGSHTEKANCWYHSSRDNINTQPVELLLVHLMRPLGLPHAVPSTMADGLGDLSLPPNTFLDAPSLSYTPALTTGVHGTRPGPTEPTTVPDLCTTVSPTCSPVAFKGLGVLCKVKTIFTTIPGCYLPFSLSFSHECTVEFSRH